MTNFVFGVLIARKPNTSERKKELRRSDGGVFVAAVCYYYSRVTCSLRSGSLSVLFGEGAADRSVGRIFHLCRPAEKKPKTRVLPTYLPKKKNSLLAVVRTSSRRFESWERNPRLDHRETICSNRVRSFRFDLLPKAHM